MSNFTNLNEIFHIFSKSPVADGQTLAKARNKSGHTVTTSDIWAEDIPAFFSAPTKVDVEKFKALAKDNDLCYDDVEKAIFYFKNGEWIRRDELKDNELLANYEASKLGIYNDGSLEDESKAVVKYYKNRDGIEITVNNNNTTSGNKYSVRIAKGNSFVPQFVSSMDKLVDGNPSMGYEPVVNNGNITEDIKDEGTTPKYIANNYAGIIQFHKQLTLANGKLQFTSANGTKENVTISAFEYIGKKLNDVLENKETPIVSDSTHDISHKFDNTNNVKNFKDGIITFSDGTTDEVDVQKAVIAKYLFRGNSSSTIEEFNKRDSYSGYNNHRNDFYYEYDVFDTQKYDDDITNGKENLSTLQNVINGKCLFLRSQLTTFNDDLSCLMNGFQMFGNSKNLATFRSALPSLTNGIRMFYGCPKLTKFETKLPNLVLAECMFANNTSLETINTCLPNLTHAQGMFGGCSNLSKIRFSKNSFQCLYNGCDMFNGCSKIGEFYYELPYLETADNMFLDCQLDVKSVRIIAESLYDFGSKDSNDYAEDGRKHVITIGIRQGDIDKVQTYIELIDSKGWVVEINEYSGDSPLPPSEDEPNEDPTPDPIPDPVSYDISETNPDTNTPYVSDIPAWRKDRYEAYNLKITNIPYDANRNVGLMIGTDGVNN